MKKRSGWIRLKRERDQAVLTSWQCVHCQRNSMRLFWVSQQINFQFNKCDILTALLWCLLTTFKPNPSLCPTPAQLTSTPGALSFGAGRRFKPSEPLLMHTGPHEPVSFPGSLTPFRSFWEACPALSRGPSFIPSWCGCGSISLDSWT